MLAPYAHPAGAETSSCAAPNHIRAGRSVRPAGPSRCRPTRWPAAPRTAARVRALMAASLGFATVGGRRCVATSLVRFGVGGARVCGLGSRARAENEFDAPLVTRNPRHSRMRLEGLAQRLRELPFAWVTALMRPPRRRLHDTKAHIVDCRAGANTGPYARDEIEIAVGQGKWLRG